MFLRTLMESLLRRLQAIIHGQGNLTTVSTSQRSRKHKWSFSEPKSINKGRAYPKCTWGIILSSTHCINNRSVEACNIEIYGWLPSAARKRPEWPLKSAQFKPRDLAIPFPSHRLETEVHLAGPFFYPCVYILGEWRSTLKTRKAVLCILFL